MLNKISDLPKEAEEERKTLQDYEQKIIDLKRELALNKSQKPQIIQKDNSREIEMAYQRGIKENKKMIEGYLNTNRVLQKKLEQISKLCNDNLPFTLSKPETKEIPSVQHTIQKEASSVQYNGQDKLRAGAMKMLNWIASSYPEHK